MFLTLLCDSVSSKSLLRACYVFNSFDSMSTILVLMLMLVLMFLVILTLTLIILILTELKDLMAGPAVLRQCFILYHPLAKRQRDKKAAKTLKK